jgi:hypothetical protein
MTATECWYWVRSQEEAADEKEASHQTCPQQHEIDATHDMRRWSPILQVLAAVGAFSLTLRQVPWQTVVFFRFPSVLYDITTLFTSECFFQSLGYESYLYATIVTSLVLPFLVIAALGMVWGGLWTWKMFDMHKRGYAMKGTHAGRTNPSRHQIDSLSHSYSDPFSNMIFKTSAKVQRGPHPWLELIETL